MAKIDFSKETKDLLVRKLTRHLKDELDVEVGGFEADFLFDFVAETLGPYFYNQGLRDAQTLFRDKFESITEAIYEIEQPVRS